MQNNEFFQQVQHRARLSSRDEAVEATRATLQTLAERLPGGTADSLSSHLPPQIASFIAADDIENGQRFDLDEFYERVAERADVDESDASQQARVVLEVLGETLNPPALEKLLDELPAQFGRLFAAASVTASRRGTFSALDEEDEDEDE